jgi:hypothetical protein
MQWISSVCASCGFPNAEYDLGGKEQLVNLPGHTGASSGNQFAVLLEHRAATGESLGRQREQDVPGLQRIEEFTRRASLALFKAMGFLEKKDYIRRGARRLHENVLVDGCASLPETLEKGIDELHTR